MKAVSIIFGVVLLLFSGVQLRAIAKGMMVQSMTFYTTMLLFLTSITLILTGKLWVILLGLGFWVLILMSVLPFTNAYIVTLVKGWHPSAFVCKVYYFVLILVSLYIYLRIVSSFNNWGMLRTMIIGFLAYLVLWGTVYMLSNLNISEENWNKYKQQLGQDVKK